MPSVIVSPGMSNVAPPSAVRCSVEREGAGPVEAPTVVTHGPPWSAVAAAGPELPAEALTEIPALERVEEGELDRVGVRVARRPRSRS